MRQKDVGKVAAILEREMKFAMPHEVEGLRTAIGAIRADLAWSQPELDLSPLLDAFNTTPRFSAMPQWQPRFPIPGRD